ncbi:MAG: glycosyltransferase [Spirosomataceae bacterium]
MNISICLATYNGESYIKIQLDSIIPQIEKNDEIIVVDDCSVDNTVNIIESFNDDRIKIFKNEVNRGHVYSFNRAIELATNEIIFMSDQDDIWKNNRVNLMKSKLLTSNALLLSSNSEFIDSNGIEIDYRIDGVIEKNSNRYFRNIIDIFKGKTNYYGCAMVFRRELKRYILPIPRYVESHDLWIAMAANLLGTNLHFEEVTLQRRIHISNASVISRSLLPKLWSRIVFLVSVFDIFVRKSSHQK